MQGYLAPTLYSLSALLIVWAAARMITDQFVGDKRRLKARLNQGERATEVSSNQRSIRKDLTPEGFEGKLLRFGFFRNVRSLILLSRPDVKFMNFLGLCAGLFAAGFLLMMAFFGAFIVSMVAGALMGVLPLLYLVRKKNARQRMLDDQLPDAMDFLGRALKAGHSLGTGLHMMADELPQPLAGEFRKAYDQHSLGIPMDVVLKDMTTRIDSTDFAFFVTAVLIQRQTGGDLSEVLTNISGMIRQRIRLQQQVKAKTAEGRFTGYLLTAFPAVMFVISYVMNAEYAGRLVNTSLGLQMLGAAFAMQVIGLFVIRKITTVKV
jgi:tight adherence protein B